MGMKTFRLRQMEQYILEHDTVSMEELCARFDISMNTTRQDVASLVSKGTVRKIYGGVCANQTNNLIPFEERRLRNIEAKRSIGKAAAELVMDGDVIYIDSGTTTMYMADFMEDKKNVTIITNNFNAISRTLSRPELTVICLPGTLERRTNSFVSAETGRMLEHYNIRKAFMAATGVGAGGEVTNSSPLEFEIKGSAIKNSAMSYLLADSSKFGRTSLMKYANLSQMEQVITDEGVDEEYLLLCRDMGVGVIRTAVNAKDSN